MAPLAAPFPIPWECPNSGRYASTGSRAPSATSLAVPGESSNMGMGDAGSHGPKVGVSEGHPEASPGDGSAWGSSGYPSA